MNKITQVVLSLFATICIYEPITATPSNHNKSTVNPKQVQSAQIKLFSALQGSWKTECRYQYIAHHARAKSRTIITRGKAESFLENNRFFINNQTFQAFANNKKYLGEYFSHSVYLLNPPQHQEKNKITEDFFKKYDFFTYSPYEETYKGL